MLTIQARVGAGAAFLDRCQPDWIRQIDLQKLDMSDPQDCMFGQIFGSFEEGIFRIELGSHARQEALPEESLGFEAIADQSHTAQMIAEYAALTDEWRRVILERRRVSWNWFHDLIGLFAPRYAAT